MKKQWRGNAKQISPFKDDLIQPHIDTNPQLEYTLEYSIGLTVKGNVYCKLSRVSQYDGSYRVATTTGDDIISSLTNSLELMLEEDI
jgi:hypothetical protein